MCKDNNMCMIYLGVRFLVLVLTILLPISTVCMSQWYRILSRNDKVRGSTPCAGCDTVAEWLRRWIANPLLFECESSNLSGVEIIILLESFTIICFGLSPDRSSPLISLSGEFGRFHGTYLSTYHNRVFCPCPYFLPILIV